MSFINKFKKINNKIKILYYLKKYEIINFELIEDHEYGYVVNVNGDVNLFNKHLKNIPFQFNIVKGDFICKYNFLKTLKGCPKVVHGKFDCTSNELKSLEGCPEKVNGGFYCENNKLVSLKFIPKIIEGNFVCSYNDLETLEGCPEIITGYFDCSDNKLTLEELQYLPKEIQKNFINIIYNKKLGNLQNINSFNELKEKINQLLEIKNIKKEKEILLNNMNKDVLNKNKSINKI